MNDCSQEEALGIDVGGVIIDRVNDNTDTSFFGDKYLETTAVPGAIEAIARLVAGRFGKKSYIVSKCGANVEARTRRWLEHHGFYGRTGIAPDRFRFCRRRQDKAGICAELGITHFVDDRLEVLGYLTTVPHRYLFRPNPNEIRKFGRHLPSVRTVTEWAEIRRDLMGE